MHAAIVSLIPLDSARIIGRESRMVEASSGTLTRVKEHDGFEKSELRVVDLNLLERLHQLVHYPDAHLADVQVLLIVSLYKLQ